MSRPSLLLVLCLAGCGAAEQCRIGTGDCEGLDQAAGAGQLAFARLVQGWSLDVSWQRVGGLPVAINPATSGKAFCGSRRVEVETDDWNRSNLVHELAHIVDGCAHTHAELLQMGVPAAITEATGVMQVGWENYDD